MKKLLFILLTLAMCVSMCACGSNVDETSKIIEKNNESSIGFESEETPENNMDISNEENLETDASLFEFVDGPQGYIITGYIGNETVIKIPSVHNNKKVVDLENTVFSGNIKIEKMILSEYMVTVDLADFNGCDNLTVIIYPGEISSISTVNGPQGLTELRFPKATIFTNSQLRNIVNENPNLLTLDISSLDFNLDEDYSFFRSKNIIISKEIEKAILNFEVYKYYEFTTGLIVETQTPIDLYNKSNTMIFSDGYNYAELLSGIRKPAETSSIHISYNNHKLKSELYASFSDIIEDCLSGSNGEYLIDSILLNDGLVAQTQCKIYFPYFFTLDDEDHDVDDLLGKTNKSYEYILQ